MPVFVWVPRLCQYQNGTPSIFQAMKEGTGSTTKEGAGALLPSSAINTFNAINAIQSLDKSSRAEQTTYRRERSRGSKTCLDIMHAIVVCWHPRRQVEPVSARGERGRSCDLWHGSCCAKARHFAPMIKRSRLCCFHSTKRHASKSRKQAEVNSRSPEKRRGSRSPSGGGPGKPCVVVAIEKTLDTKKIWRHVQHTSPTSAITVEPLRSGMSQTEYRVI